MQGDILDSQTGKKASFSEGESMDKARILVIDDEVTIRRLLFKAVD